MNYEKIYYAIIENRKLHPLSNEEKRREHYICHWLLTKIYPSKEMTMAFWLFHSWNKSKGYVNSWAYQRNREEWCKLNGEMHRHSHAPTFTRKRTTEEIDKMKRAVKAWWDSLSLSDRREFIERRNKSLTTEEYRKKISDALSGRKFTEDHKRKISEALKGRIFSEEHRRKLKEANHNRNFSFSEEAKKKMSESRKGNRWWNNGTEERCCKDHPGNGWNLGRLK